MGDHRPHRLVRPGLGGVVEDRHHPVEADELLRDQVRHRLPQLPRRHLAARGQGEEGVGGGDSFAGLLVAHTAGQGVGRREAERAVAVREDGERPRLAVAGPHGRRQVAGQVCRRELPVGGQGERPPGEGVAVAGPHLEHGADLLGQPVGGLGLRLEQVPARLVVAAPSPYGHVHRRIGQTAVPHPRRALAARLRRQAARPLHLQFRERAGQPEQGLGQVGRQGVHALGLQQFQPVEQSGRVEVAGAGGGCGQQDRVAGALLERRQQFHRAAQIEAVERAERRRAPPHPGRGQGEAPAVFGGGEGEEGAVDGFDQVFVDLAAVVAVRDRVQRVPPGLQRLAQLVGRAVRPLGQARQQAFEDVDVLGPAQGGEGLDEFAG